MSTKIDFLYLSEPDMIKAGVKDMGKCVEVMEDMMVTLNKGDYVMGGENHNSHGCMVTFPDNPEFEGMPKNGEDRRFMAMPAYLGGNFKMAGMKWYGSNTENKMPLTKMEDDISLSSGDARRNIVSTLNKVQFT